MLLWLMPGASGDVEAVSGSGDDRAVGLIMRR
jgi:hypothetical protein